MMYYSTSKVTEPHITFIGRWSPLHRGHIAIIQKVRNKRPGLPVLILVRDRQHESYSPLLRAAYIRSWMEKEHIWGSIMIVPDIEGIYWGRDVGYKTEQVDVEEEMKRISGTSIRTQIQDGGEDWKKFIAINETSALLSPRIGRIAEKGYVIWLTGCPASGKSTVSNALKRLIHKRYPYLPISQLDGDVMRNTPISKDIGFTGKERALHLERMAYIAKLLADRGTFVICSFVSPTRASRTLARTIIGARRFLEVYVDAPLETRIRRDKKSLYKKAAQGKIPDLTGYNAPYEPPIAPGVHCKTDTYPPSQCADTIFRKIFIQHP